MAKTVGTKTFEWVEKLHAAGATKPGDGGETITDPVVRSMIATMHAYLAGGTDNSTYQELETTYDEAMAEANASGDPDPLFP